MGVKDLIKKMEELAADGEVESSNNAAPSHKAAAPVTRPAVASPAEDTPKHNIQPAAEQKREPITPAAASNGSAKKNGAQLPADSGPGKEPEDPEKKAKKVQECSVNQTVILMFSH